MNLGLIWYLVNSAAWFAIGVMATTTYVRKEERMMRTFVKEGAHFTLLGMAVLLIVAITFVIASVNATQQLSYARKQTEYAKCQTAVVKQLIKVSESRAKSADLDRVAQNEFYDSVFASKSREESFAAYRRYITVRSQLDRARVEYPPFPEAICPQPKVP